MHSIRDCVASINVYLHGIGTEEGKEKVMKARTAIFLIIGLFILTSLACAQAGEILTPAEATARAQEVIQSGASFGSSSVAGGSYEAGDTATLIGRNFLVNLYDAPDGKISAGQERGATVTILEVATVGDAIWYKIEAPTGEGWVSGASLEPVAEEEVVIEGPQAGDAAYLAGRSFLVNLLDAPDGKIVAGQERGMAITIIEVVQVDGVVWYHVDAPTGQGWVPAENVTTEAP